MVRRLLRLAIAMGLLALPGARAAEAQSHSMVLVPAGEFPMGDAWRLGNSNEWPVHEVHLDEYFIDQFEVTTAQFAEVLNWAHQTYYLRDEDNDHYDGGDVYYAGRKLIELESRYSTIAYDDRANRFYVPVREGVVMLDHPVVMVTWYGAANYCNWRSEMDGLTPCYTGLNAHHVFCNFQADGYRLPTEAEWEKAASYDPSIYDPVAGPRRQYGFVGDFIGFRRANYYNPDSGEFNNPMGFLYWPFTAPVGCFNGVNRWTLDSPSPWGCYDMSGNVWEWCWDWFDNGYYEDSPYWNPRGPWERDTRVVRGGSWIDAPSNLRATRRADWSPYLGERFLGFRTARIPSRPPDLVIEGFDFAPDVVAAGDRIHFGGRVVNAGRRPAGPFWIEFRVSASADFALPRWFLADSIYVPQGLQPGHHVELSVVERFVYSPAQGLPVGDYIAGIVVDPTDAVAEGDETNNIAYVPAHRLRVEAVSPSRQSPTDARQWFLYR